VVLLRPRHRAYAALLALGASISVGRTIVMQAQGAAAVLVPRALGLLLIEMLIDVTALTGAVLWWKHGTLSATRLALRAGATAALVHAGRVLIFVLGRTGPWTDFDVRPEQRASHAVRWTWGEVSNTTSIRAMRPLAKPKSWPTIMIASAVASCVERTRRLIYPPWGA